MSVGYLSERTFLVDFLPRLLFNVDVFFLPFCFHWQIPWTKLKTHPISLVSFTQDNMDTGYFKKAISDGQLQPPRLAAKATRDEFADKILLVPALRLFHGSEPLSRAHPPTTLSRMQV